MNFEFDETQAALVSLASSVLTRKAGAERARAVMAGSGYDTELEAELTELGLLDLARDSDAGPLEAALVTDRVAYHQGQFAVGVRALVLPMLGLEIDGPVGLATDRSSQPLRFGDHLRHVVVLGDSSVSLAQVSSTTEAGFMTDYSVRRVAYDIVEELDPDLHGALARWWRIATSAEIAGSASAALDLTVGYVSERFQFGRALGSFQAIQHRLAEVYVAIEGTRWMARYAAFLETDDEAAALAAASAVEAARLAIWELHQLTGAIGFTKEYDLHLLSMRLHTLRVELDGASGGHERSAADLRWDVSRPAVPGEARQSAILASMSPRS